MVMSMVASIYDPLGIICPITIGVKILLKATHRIPDITWDVALPEDLQVRWIEAISCLIKMEKIKVRRSVRPEGASGPLELIGYWDGADPAFVAYVYMRWDL